MTPLDDLPERTAPGSCIDCTGWTATGRVVAEIHTDAGAGATLVRCAACASAKTSRPSRLPLTARRQGRAST